MNDCANYWIDHDLGDLECLSAAYVSHRFAPHVHEEFVIGVIQAGAQSLRYRGGREIMPENTVCVINPDEPHTGQAATAQGWIYRVIYPSPSVLRNIARQIAGRPVETPYFDKLVIPDDHLIRQFLTMHSALESAHTSLLAKESLLNWTLAQLILRHAAKRPTGPGLYKFHPGVARARDYLDAHHARSIKLDELAGVARMSPFHFVRTFSAVVGAPPHVYQLRSRIQAAKRLLSQGQSIAEAALATGFADQSHLTNRFKAVVGVTPGAFRKNSNNLQDRSE